MKKKVLFFITGLGRGGAEVMLLKILPKLKYKYDIKLVSLLKKDEIGKEIEKKGIEVVYLNNKGFNPIKTILNFRKIIKQFKPDLLFTFLIHADIFGRVFGKMFGVKKVYCSIRNDYSKITKLYLMDRFTRFLVDKYIPNSFALNDYLENKIGVKREKISIIPNAIDLDNIYLQIDENFDLREYFKIPKNRFVIVSIGRFMRQKDYPTLIRAVYTLKNKYKRKINLILIGYGEEEGKLKSLVNDLDLRDDVFFPGDSYYTRFSIVKSSDLFVLPSLTEGMSNSILEAMSFKKACIVSDIKQNKVLIKNNKNGLTFKVGNYYDLAKKIEKLIGNSKLRKEFGSKAYEDIIENYELESIAKQFERVIG
jgi:glycosyltransferase involved in cell wall biosynthesis